MLRLTHTSRPIVSPQTTSIARIIYVARFCRRELNIDHQKAMFTKMFEKHYPDGEIAGILLLYPTCCVHVIEVISSTEDVPARCFGSWQIAYVASPSSLDVMDALEPSLMVKSATSINNFLRKLGPTLVGLAEPALWKRLHSLEAFYEDVPSLELVLSMVASDEAPSIAEYLDIYDAPVNVDLDSELVWPMPAPIEY
ncbi:MAG: hypothetical protein WDW38_010997 [Sanguina aurantia]